MKTGALASQLALAQLRANAAPPNVRGNLQV